MPSKISYFQSIQWKLFLYFMGILLLAVTIIMLLFGPPPERGMFQGLMMRHDVKTGMMARQIGDQFSRGHDPAVVQANLMNMAFLSESLLKLIDREGRILLNSQFNIPGFAIQEVTLSPEDLQRLKQGNWVSGRKSLNQRDLTLAIHYSAFPIYSNRQMKGILFSLIPLGPPERSKALMKITILQGALCGLIISSAAAFLLSWNFLRPILALRKASEKLSKGDFSTRIDTKSTDEFGDLARAFDSMSSKLKENIEGRMRLIGDISHELNSPLTALRVNIEAVIDGITDIQNKDERDRVLNIMLHQTKRTSVLVDDLLELAKFEAGAIKMNIQPFTALEPVKSVIESVKVAAASKKMTVDFDIDNENARVMGDKTRITQVLQNLVNNAIQHNLEGIHIQISLAREENSVRFSIKDDGIGIPPQERENVFKRFHRLDRERMDDRSGSGLGLAIVKEIIEAHGSRIMVESPSKGTIFFFSLQAV